ncbi:MAG: DinB family protein [Bryobacteraceae bacterium]
MNRSTVRMSLLAAVVAGMVVAPAARAEGLQQGERDRAMSYLHATRKQFLDIATAVSDAQWNYKPPAGAWSLAEVAEHITLSEDLIYGMEQKIAGGAAAVGKKSAATDEQVAQKLTDRSFKAQAPEPLKPSHRWKSREGLLAEFKKWRDRTIEYVEKTPVDLRARLAPHPLFGDIDAYQWVLLIAAHSERHILQMREVMESPGYPRQTARR